MVGNVSLSDAEEHIFHNGFRAYRPTNQMVTIFGSSITMCGRYNVRFLSFFSLLIISLVFERIFN